MKLGWTTSSTKLLIASSYTTKRTKYSKNTYMYNITCIQRPPKTSNKGSLLQQVVIKCGFY